MDVLNFVKSEFAKYTEADYKKFSASLIPNIDNVLGIRIPILRKIAKQVAKLDPQKFLDEHEEIFMEDTMLKGMVIAYLGKDFNSMLVYVEDFVPKINNWAVCDIFCGGLKFFKKDKERAFEFLTPYINSKDEYYLRFACVMLLTYFVDKDFIDKVLKILFGLKSEYYYANMAIAWAISICYVKFPDKTLKYLQNNTLEDFCHNKAISKIIESYRVTKEDKERLKLIKRAKKSPISAI